MTATAVGNRIRIGISGSYGGMNLGDEAILAGILGQLRQPWTRTSPSSPRTPRTRWPGMGSRAPSHLAP